MGKTQRTDPTIARLPSAVAVILKDIPPGYNWGWFSREDPRMHLQTPPSPPSEGGARGGKHQGKLSHKVWLEERGRRVLEPVAKVPAKILKSLIAELTPDRLHVEAQWAGFMIDNDWLELTVTPPHVTLIAYPGTPNRFSRSVDLREHLGEHGLAQLKPEDVILNGELAALEIWPRREEGRRLHIRIAPLLWLD